VALRLERYVLREVLGPTLVAFAAYTGFMLVRGLVQFSTLVLQSEDPLGDTGLVLALSLPHIVVLTIPVAFLLGLLVGVGRLSADSELTALRASGIDLVRLYLPIGVLAVVCWLATTALMVFVVPRTNELLYTLRLRLSAFAIVQRIQPGVFSPEFAGFRIYVEGGSPDRKSLTGLIVADRSNPAEGERLTLARRGALEADEAAGRLWLRLEEAVSHHTQDDPTRYDRTSYAVQRVLLQDVDPKRSLHRVGPDKLLREQTLSELVATAKALRSPIETRLAWVEVHKKFALPAACLVFGLIGLPLGIVTRRGGRAAGFAISVAIVLGYYVLYATGEAKAIEGNVSALLAMWLPNALLLVLGAAALYRSRRDRSVLPAITLPGIASLLRRRGKAQEVGSRSGSGRQMLLLDRYVAMRFLRVFALVSLSIVTLYLLIDYLEINDDLAKTHPGLPLILGYYEAFVFPILLDVVPFAFLVAALIAVAGLVRASETTAWLASGVSLYRVVLSLICLAVLAGGVLHLLSEHIVPRAATEAERLRDLLLKRPPAPSSEQVNGWFRGEKGRFFHVETFDPETKRLTGVSVLDLDPATFRLIDRTDAATAVLTDNGVRLEDSWTRHFGPTGESLLLRRPGVFELPAPGVTRVFMAGRADPRQMTYRELSRFIGARRRAGANVAALRTGLYQKTAIPISTLLLTMVGLPFAFRYGKRGAVAGIGIALLLGLAYFFVSQLLVGFGERGSLPPLLAAWGANLFFGLGALHELLGVRT